MPAAAAAAGAAGAAGAAAAIGREQKVGDMIRKSVLLPVQLLKVAAAAGVDV
jgi:hypothetical protein